MLTTLRMFFSAAYWRDGFYFKDLLSAILGALGTVYLLAKLSDWLTPHLSEWAKQYSNVLVWVALLYAFATAIWTVRPQKRVSCNLKGRDVVIAIEVGDLFSSNEAIVIGTNRTFDTELSDTLISAKSTQGQFTRRYYSDENHLAADIAVALKGTPSTVNTAKTVGNQNEYPFGTVAMITPKFRRVYMLAIASLNNTTGRASGSLEDLKSSLAALWEFIGSHGDIEPIRVPILGTGFTRLTEQRPDIVRELIKSFIAACSDRRFCDQLTIVISYKDYQRHKINLKELGNYLQWACQYTDLKGAKDTGQGVGIPA